jgi:hypothetical protein
MSSEKKKNPIIQMTAGAVAGFVESTICHPLDTIKTRMQIRKQQSSIDYVRARSSLHEPEVIKALNSLAEPKIVLRTEAASSKTRFSVGGSGAVAINRIHDPDTLSKDLHPSSNKPPQISTTIRHSPLVAAPLGPLGTARRMINREGFLSLYKGLTAVYSGIIPKMAIRFVAFEQYREIMQKMLTSRSISHVKHNSSVNFIAGLLSGLTEAVIIVTPAEVCKIRMQAQYNSLMDPAQMAHRKYTNVVQTAITIVREEGLSALYKGVLPTMLRQGCNQAVNFTMYNWFKSLILDAQNTDSDKVHELKPWQSLLLGGISGGFGPLLNNPLGECEQSDNWNFLSI